MNTTNRMKPVLKVQIEDSLAKANRTIAANESLFEKQVIRIQQAEGVSKSVAYAKAGSTDLGKQLYTLSEQARADAAKCAEQLAELEGI